MRQSDITFQDKLNELRLALSHPSAVNLNFILVEGSSDIRLFRKFFDLDKCKVEIVPGGNEKLEECVTTLVTAYPLVIGIRDSDFIKLEASEYSKRNLFLTDFHDIEMTMINNESVLNSIVFEFSDVPKEQHLKIRNDVIESINLLGCLKWLNVRENLEFDFSCGFQDLISFVNVEIDIDQYIDRMLSKSKNAKINSKEVILEKIFNLKAQNPDIMQLTNGHDLMNALAKYFRDAHGVKGLSGENIESMVRMLFNNDLFQRTNLYENLSYWANQNNTRIFVNKMPVPNTVHIAGWG